MHSVERHRRRGSRFSFSSTNSSSSTYEEEVEIEGQASLFFSDTLSFEGIINTNGDSNYTIHGEISSFTPTISPLQQTYPKSTLSYLSSSISSTESSTPYESEEDFEGDDTHLNQNSHEYVSLEKTKVNSFKSDLHYSRIEDEEILPYYTLTILDHYTGCIYRFLNIKVNDTILKTQNKDKEQDQIFVTHDRNVQIQFNLHQIFKGQKAIMVTQKNLGTSPKQSNNCIVYSGFIKLSFPDSYAIPNRKWCL